MDKECINLCDAINSIEGLMTIESCCGHGKDNFQIYFVLSDLSGAYRMRHLLYWLDG